MFLIGLVQLLDFMETDTDTIARTLHEYREGRVIKTDSRKILGTMTDLVHCYCTDETRMQIAWQLLFWNRAPNYNRSSYWIFEPESASSPRYFRKIHFRARYIIGPIMAIEITKVCSMMRSTSTPCASSLTVAIFTNKYIAETDIAPINMATNKSLRKKESMRSLSITGIRMIPMPTHTMQTKLTNSRDSPNASRRRELTEVPKINQKNKKYPLGLLIEFFMIDRKTFLPRLDGWLKSIRQR